MPGAQSAGRFSVPWAPAVQSVSACRPLELPLGLPLEPLELPLEPLRLAQTGSAPPPAELCGGVPDQSRAP